jgi:histidyl-tRNA synthetase
VLTDYLDAESQTDFARLCELLQAASVPYVVNPQLVRGLDYYNKTVFEWVTDRLGAQGTVCAGGRYDGLVEQLGGKSTPGVGFALGKERLVLLLEALAVGPPAAAAADIYVVNAGAAAELAAVAALEALRDALPALRMVQHAGGGSFRSQLKKADKSGARWALIWGEDEAASGTVTVKSLREQGPQESMAVADLAGYLSHQLSL